MNCADCGERTRYTGSFKRVLFGWKVVLDCPNGHVDFQDNSRIPLKKRD